VAEPPPKPVEKQPDIALEREKQRKQEEAKRREEEEQRKQLEAQKRKAEEQKRVAEEKKKREEQAKKEKLKKEQEAKLREQARKDQLARMQQALAEGNGSPSSRGLAQKASGPSDSYAGRIRARVKPNIVFADDAPGNPSAEVEVRMAPDGTIVSRKITKSSGLPSWDQAVLRALDRTEVLPRDVDGRVHTPLIIAFKLRD
jgi:colicin import membrane protein